ncbi:hypothetical protein PS676_04543 [Pseudomonas fluorescens]|nr:hypothetical protein PS676_04543 [Pseudomonas fluorescens]
MGFTDLRQQLRLDRGGIGASAAQRGWLGVKSTHFDRVQIGGQQQIRLGQGKTNDRPIQIPVPTRLPRQCTGQIGGLCRGVAHVVDAQLLIRREHFQQQTALRAPLSQRLQQPALQFMVIAIVMLLPHDQSRRLGQTRQQLLCRQPLTAVQVANLADNRWRLRNMLTSTQHQHRQNHHQTHAHPLNQ